jgi:hypothetical protein
MWELAQGSITDAIYYIIRQKIRNAITKKLVSITFDEQVKKQSDTKQYL